MSTNPEKTKPQKAETGDPYDLPPGMTLEEYDALPRDVKILMGYPPFDNVDISPQDSH